MGSETISKVALAEAGAGRASDVAAAADGRSFAFERLHALVRRGYTPAIGPDAERNDVIVLRHLGKAPDLVLHADGRVEGWEGRRPRHKRHIDAPIVGTEGDSEQLKFMKFLDSVPKASLRERTLPWRKKYIYFPIVLIVVWFVCLLTAMTLINT